MRQLKMGANYDALVKEHYDSVAGQDGDQPTSTMADQFVRETETEEILRVIERAEISRTESRHHEPITIADVGCGNGYTLGKLRDSRRIGFYLVAPRTKPVLIGVEQNDSLRAIAARQDGVRVIPGDLRDPSSIAIEPGSVDCLICQRVIINIMDPEHQKKALQTCVDLVKPGGSMLFIEVFQSGFDRLNEARAEWDLPAIPPAHHNLPLPDDFFAGQSRIHEVREPKRHQLSTHFFVTRILHELELRAAGKKDFIRNSHYVRFLSGALQNFGEYAPLQFVAFDKER